MYSQICGDFNSSDISFIQILNLIFSSKNLITSFLNNQNYIYIIFQAGQIAICGKTGETKICFRPTRIKSISHFISKTKTYFISYIEQYDNFIVYHITSGELFLFVNSSLKSILLNSNSKLDYEFFKNNGKSSGFVNSKDHLFVQMMHHICNIKYSQISDVFSKPRFKTILNEIENI